MASCLSGGPMSSRLAHNVSRQGRFTSTFGRVGRRPGIKNSARSGSRHSGVRLEVSLGTCCLEAEAVFAEPVGLGRGVAVVSVATHGFCTKWAVLEAGRGGVLGDNKDGSPGCWKGCPY